MNSTRRPRQEVVQGLGYVLWTAVVLASFGTGAASAAQPKGQPRTAAQPKAAPPKAAPTKTPSLQPTVVIEAKLLIKSPTPNARQLGTYTEGLVVYKYEVVKVTQGTLNAKTVVVAHWGVKRSLEQPVTKTAVGALVTLSLCPFEALGTTKGVYRSDATNDISPLYFDAGQKIELPVDERGRWNYGCTLSRVMRCYFLLREQLKLVVLGDCQGWFGARTRHYFPEENAKVPVTLSMTCERTCLSFYDTMARYYLVKAPNLEWAVFAWQTRWVNGTTKWRGFGTFNEDLKNSPGFNYDLQHADTVFANRNPPPLTHQDVLANSEVGASWARNPWGDFYGQELPPWTPQGERKHNYHFPDQPPEQFSQERWAQWDGIVKVLTDRKIRVLAYIIPFNGRDPNKLDKLGTNAECYDYEVKSMKALEEKYKGMFFFYDFNNKGDNCLEPADNPLDHPAATGAVKVSTEVNAFLQDVMRKNNIPTRTLTAKK